MAIDPNPPSGDPAVFTFDPYTYEPVTPPTADQADTQMIPRITDRDGDDLPPDTSRGYQYDPYYDDEAPQQPSPAPAGPGDTGQHGPAPEFPQHHPPAPAGTTPPPPAAAPAPPQHAPTPPPQHPPQSPPPAPAAPPVPPQPAPHPGPQQSQQPYPQQPPQQPGTPHAPAAASIGDTDLLPPIHVNPPRHARRNLTPGRPGIPPQQQPPQPPPAAPAAPPVPPQRPAPHAGPTEPDHRQEHAGHNPTDPLETGMPPAVVAACALRVAEELESVYRGDVTFSQIADRIDHYRSSATSLAHYAGNDISSWR